MPLPPPPVPASAPGGGSAAPDWRDLSEPLLLLVLQSLEPCDLAAAHLVARGWRSAACRATRWLLLAGHPPDTQRIKQTFPNLSELCLERMELPRQSLACVASLAGLSSLSLRMCRLSEAGSMSELQKMAGLQELHLCDVLGPSAEELDDAIKGLTLLHRLHVESVSASCKAPSLRSLAFLPRIRHLSVKQARPRHGFVGLTNLGSLQDLQALELRGTTVTNSIMRRLSQLSGLTCLRMPEASLVTDHGWEALARLTALQVLDLSCWRLQMDGPVSNVGTAHLAPLERLTSLSLAGRAPVTAHGLGHLSRFTRLQSLDLARVQLDQGSASFLWNLTQLTHLSLRGTKMASAQFEGLPNLVHLVELDVSGTLFDDACCFDGLPRLESLNLSHTHATSVGVCQLSTRHAGRLRRLQLDGCQVSMATLLSVLRCQPGGICLWDPTLRGYLPRWVNLANTLLMCQATPERQRLRLRHAPEAERAQHAAMAGLAAAMLAAHALLLFVTLALLLLLPVAGLVIGAGLLLMVAVGKRPALGSIMQWLAKGEVWLSAVLVGVLSCRVPPPPHAADQPQW